MAHSNFGLSGPVSSAAPRNVLRRSLRLVSVLAIALVALTALIWLMGGVPQRTLAAGPLYVAPGGACGGATPCFATIQAAVNAASSGDEIRVAAGTYTDVNTASGVTQTVYLNKSVVLRGGFTTTDWTEPDPDVNLSIIDPAGQGRGIYIGGAISPTVEGFVIRNGRAPGDANGGGIYNAAGNPILRRNTIHANSTGSGSGGGIYDGGSALIEYNEVYSNSAGFGAGIFALAGTADIRFNAIYSNAATTNGGGLRSDNGARLINGNTIFSNTADVGAGLTNVLGAARIWNNIFHHNQAASRGGGIALGVSAPQIWHNTLVENTAAITGGGIYIAAGGATPSISNTIIVSNTATTGGAIYNDGSAINVYSNTIRGNASPELVGVTANNPVNGDPLAFVDPAGNDYHLAPGAFPIDRGGATGSVPDDFDGEGRPFGSGFDVGADEVYSASSCYARIDAGPVYDDLQTAVDAASPGDLVKVAGRCTSSNPEVLRLDKDLTVQGGYTTTNWLLPTSGPTILDGEGARRAVVIAGSSAATLDGFRIIGGSASGPGGGVYIAGSAAPTVQNNVIYGNSAVDGGGVANESSGAVRLWNNTVVFNDASAGSGGGIYNAAGTLLISNTIVASNTASSPETGVHAAAGAVVMDYNLLFNNSSNVTAGPHDAVADPQFVDPAGGDFHLALTSPALAAGDPNTTVATDIDGDSRPLGPDFDIGADEGNSYTGVRFTPDITNDVESNDVVVYTHLITNAGTVSDTFGLTHTATVTWPVSYSSTVSLDAGQSRTFQFFVTIPLDADPGVQAIFWITATSTVNANASASVRDESRVLPTHKVDIEPSYTGPTAVYVEPPAVVTFSHVLTNTGNFTDTYNLSLVNPLNWEAVLLTSTVVMTPTDQLTLTLARGATDTVRLQVSVPISAEKNLSNKINVVATSILSPTEATDMVTDTTTALGAPGTRYVSPGGSDLNNSCRDPNAPCATVAKALDQAFGLDEVRVAKGTYFESNLTVNKPVKLSGGWQAPDFNPGTRSRNPADTVIDAGGAGRVMNVSADATIEGFTLRNGLFGGSGGGINVLAGAAPTIQGNIISDNQANRGGGIYSDGGRPSLFNNMILDNRAVGGASGHGGGVYLRNGQAWLFNNTLYGNSAQGSGGGVYNAGATAVLSNTIVATNTATSGSSGVHNGSGALSADYNLLFGNSSNVPDGGHSLTAEPGFVDAAGGDFHLTVDSPALDNGDPNTNLPIDPATGVQIDFEGQRRPVNQGFDIGADELTGCLAQVVSTGTIYGSVQEAIDAAPGGGTVRVYGHCRGVHPLDVGGQVVSQTVHLTKALTIQGGYNASFNYDPANNTTILDAMGLGRVIFITGTIAPVLEDLEIRNGDATGLSGGAGGGVYNFNGNPVFHRTVITGNTASVGGGFYNDRGAPRLERDPTNPLADERNFLSNNDATTGGGGFYNLAGDPFFNNVFVLQNQAGNGAGIYVAGGSPDLHNTVVLSNTATSAGGGLYNAAGSQLLVLHNTFYGNDAPSGGAVHNAGGVLTATNNIFAANSAGGGNGSAVHSSGGSALASYNDAFGNSAPDYVGASLGPGNLSLDPGFVDLSSTELAAFHIDASSPLIDVGDPNTALTFDMDGDLRPSDQGFDVGADEIGGCLARVVSTGQIYGSVQRAVDVAPAGDTVQVSGRCGGTHTIDVGGTLFTQTVHLTKSVNLEGGFREDFLEQNPAVFTTTLDAGGGGHVIYVGSGVTSTIRYFDIIRGNATPGGGGGIYNAGGSPVLQNSRVYSNTATSGGGFYTTAGGQPVLEAGNHFHHNTATGNGGAIYNDGNSNLLVQNSMFYSNTATGNGGGFYNAAGAPTVRHNAFYRNSASAGGGIYSNSGAPDLWANIVRANTGYGIFDATGGALINYNDVLENTPDQYGGAAAPGTGNISADPNWANPGNADFHLLEPSPAMDAAGTITTTDPDVDFEGDPRPSHQRPDIGPDEVGGCFARLNGNPPIYGSAQLAVELASNGDSVDVAGTCRGVHTFNSELHNLHVTKNITVTGGWRSDFGAWDPLQFPTELDASGQGRVLYISGSTPTIQDLHLVNGSATLGGGIYVAAGTPGALIQANRVYSNTATTGAGLYTAGPNALTIVNNFLYNNTGTGLYSAAGDHAIWHNTLVNNSGDGLEVASGSPTVRSNIVVGNGGTGIVGPASVDADYNDVFGNGAAYGGGVSPGANALAVDPLFADPIFRLGDDSPLRDAGDPASPVNDDFENDPRPSDEGFDVGADEFNDCLAKVLSTGQVFGHVQDAIDAAADPDTILIARRNNQNDPSDLFGECRGVRTAAPGKTQVMYVNKDITFSGSWLSDFTSRDPYISTRIVADRAGRALYIESGVTASFEWLDFRNGDATGLGGGPGGADAGGVIYNAGEATLEFNKAVSGTAAYGGISYNAPGASMLITGGDFYAEGLASADGGGHYNADTARLTLTNSGVRESQAAGNGGAVYNTGLLTSTNFVAVSNTAVSNGGAFYNDDNTLRLYFNTLRENVAATGNGGAVYNSSGSLTISSTILYTNTAAGSGGGLHHNGGSATLAYNNYWDNAAGSNPDSNIGPGTSPVLADPQLAAEWLLTQFSPVIDKADPNSHVTEDAGLDPRPQPPIGQYCGGFDIGADEFNVDLGFSVSSHGFPVEVGPGQTITHTHTVVNNGNYTNTYTVTVLADTRNWVSIQSTLPFTLGPGAFTDIEFEITVPVTETGGTEETVTFRVISLCDNQNRQAEDTIIATPSYGAELEPDNFGQALPGQTIIYTHTLTNTGNLSTTYQLAASAGYYSTASVEPTSVTLDPLATALVTVTVNILDTAPGGEEDIVNVTAVFPGDEVSAADTTAISYTTGARYVDLNGFDRIQVGDVLVNGNNCTVPDSPCATIQHAVDQATNGDAILVASGAFTGVLSRTITGGDADQIAFINKSVSLAGSYDSGANWTRPPAPLTPTTTLDPGGQGRALYVQGGVTVEVDGFRLVNGDASGQLVDAGGAVYNDGGAVTLTANRITDNGAGRGAGLYSQAGNLTVRNSVLARNQGVSQGGGIHLASGSGLVENNTFYANDAAQGGGIYHGGGSLDSVNNIFDSNSAAAESGGGGAIFRDPASGPYTFAYNLLWNNTPDDYNSDLTPTGPILTEDPLLLDPAAGDFHIDGSSPAVDQGTTIAGLTTDFEYEVRPQGGGFDIGADEDRRDPGVLVEPDYDVLVDTGQIFTYPITITNVGEFTDTFSLTFSSSQGWGALLDPGPFTLNVGQSQVVSVEVTAGAPGFTDYSVLTATSSFTETVFDTATITTLVRFDPGVSFFPDRSANADPGADVVYTHTLSNIGTGLDSYTITVESENGWPVVVEPAGPTISLPAGESTTVTATLSVPTGVLSGTIHTLTLTATSVFSPAVQDTVVDTTTVNLAGGLLLFPDNAGTGDPGQVVTYTHTLSNSASFTQSVTLASGSSQGWANAVTPTLVNDLGPQQSVPVTAVVTVPLGVAAGIADVTTITATSSLSGNIQATAVDTTTVNLVAGVSLAPDNAQSTAADTVVTYTHTITNEGNGSDTFDLLAVSSQGWLVATVPPTITLAQAQTDTITVTVTVPPLSGGLVDTTTVTARSQGDPAVQATAVNTTTVVQSPGVDLEPNQSGLAFAGTTITYTHILTNTGDGQDDFRIEASSSQGWPVTPPFTITGVGAGQTRTVSIWIMVPAGTLSDTVDTTLVTATSVLSAAVFDVVTDTTTIRQTPGVDLSPGQNGLADPGLPFTYTHTITNTGNATDTFVLTVSNVQPWSFSHTPAVTLGPGLTGTVTLTLNVPPLSGGLVDTATLTATSTLSNAVFDVETDVTTVRQTPGVELAPDNTGTADPGTAITYTHIITNTGDGFDTFTLSAVSSQGWLVEHAPSVALGPTLTQTLVVTVNVPPGSGGLVDVTTLTATSGVSSAVQASAVDTTTVRHNPGLALTPDNNGSSTPGGTVVYSHILTNTGDGPDVFNLTVSSSQGWPGVSVAPVSVSLAAGQTGSVTVSVTVPTGAISGTVDRTVVTATSVASPSLFASAVDRTTVRDFERVYLPLVMKNFQAVTPPTPTPTPTPTGTPPTPTPTPTPGPRSGPDLVVTAITVVPASPQAGQPATVFVTVKNQGDRPVTFGNNFYVDFYVDRVPEPLLLGDLAWGVQGSDFGVGQSQTYSATYTFGGGPHDLYAQADTDNTVAEGDETNNVFGPQSISVTGAAAAGEEPAPPESGPRSTPTPAR